jgi:hypothetical protein
VVVVVVLIVEWVVGIVDLWDLLLVHKIKLLFVGVLTVAPTRRCGAFCENCGCGFGTTVGVKLLGLGVLRIKVGEGALGLGLTIPP